MAWGRELISNGDPMEGVVGFSRAVRVGPFIAVGGTAPVNPDACAPTGHGSGNAETRHRVTRLDSMR